MISSFKEKEKLKQIESVKESVKYWNYLVMQSSDLVCCSMNWRNPSETDLMEYIEEVMGWSENFFFKKERLVSESELIELLDTDNMGELNF